MAQALASKNDVKTHGMETRKKQVGAHLSPQTSTEMTYGDESASVVTDATQCLVDYAMTKGHTIHSLTHMTRSQLADFLRDFYVKIKSRIDDTGIDLKELRAGLHRFFLSEIAVDIIRDRTFELANATFDLALRSNSSRKYHRMRIEIEDLRKMYLSEAMDLNTPESLQNKVFFDVNLYICNRGKDYLRLMKKTDFEVSSDVNGRRYVWLKDHPKFSSGVDTNNDKDFGLTYQMGDRMYERPGDPRCPVKSFLQYVTHLHPMTDAFWQRPKRNVSPTDYVWYDHSPMGNSTLSKIMQRISIMAGMCDNYTNHAIRAAYIPLIENICLEAMGNQQGLPPVSDPGADGMVRSQSCKTELDTSSGDESSSLMSETKENETENDISDGQGLREAKMKVLEQLQKVMVRDIQKFVDWLKTVRVEYNAGELMVLCSPVEKMVVDVPDVLPEIQVPPTQKALQSEKKPHSILRQPSESLDPIPRQDSHSNSSGHGDFMGMQSISIKQVEFRSFGDTFCSLAEIAPMKVTIPTEDTILVTGIPENVQLMVHKKHGQTTTSRESIADRIFFSENEMDVAEVAALLGTRTSSHHQDGCLPLHSVYHTNLQPSTSVTTPPIATTAPVPVGPPIAVSHTQPQLQPQKLTPQNSFETKSKSELIKTKKFKSVTYHEPSPIPDLKRVSSTGTPILKRQANVVDTHYGDEPFTKRCLSEDLNHLPFSGLRRDDSLEAKRLHADRLDDSLRKHQEILQNSPLLKKQMDRHGTGFRKSYHRVKSEPVDT